MILESENPCKLCGKQTFHMLFFFKYKSNEETSVCLWYFPTLTDEFFVEAETSIYRLKLNWDDELSWKLQ